jgi:GntR family transcriptional regulator
MIFRIDPAAPLPVYLQIIEQVKRAIARGVLRPGDLLPPIRDVAVQARINRNTVARAYTELEREGLITARQGIGSIISERAAPTITRRERVRRLREQLDAALNQALLDGLDRATVEGESMALIDRLWPPVSETPPGDGKP